MPRAGEPWIDGKLRGARFGVDWPLPEADGLWAQVGRREAVLPPVLAD